MDLSGVSVGPVRCVWNGVQRATVHCVCNTSATGRNLLQRIDRSVLMRVQHAPAALATYALLFHGRLGRVTMSPSESIRHTNKASACAPGTG